MLRLPVRHAARLRARSRPRKDGVHAAGTLVAHAAIDDDALKLEDQLADEARDAERRLPGLAGSRAAGAWATLARRALERREWKVGDRHVNQLAVCDPARHELGQVRDEAAKVRAEAQSR